MKTITRFTGLMLYLWGISVFIMMVPATGQALTVSGDVVENTSEGGHALLVQKAVGASGVPIIHGEAADGTLASPEATPSNRTLFSVGGGGYTGSTWKSGSSRIRFRSSELWSESAQGSEIIFSTTPNGSTILTGRTERMRITNDGKVGIGTTVPSEALDVAGNVNTTGAVTANSFSGSGAGLTNLDPTHVTSGTASIDISGNAATASNANAIEGYSAGDIIAAASDEVRTPITSLPFDVNSSGSYYLTDNLTSTGNGINVNADDVTIDFNGFTITGPGKSSGTGYGIYMIGRKNVEIKNGTVRAFGLIGIYEASFSARGHRIINMRVMDNSGTAYGGIILFNGRNLIRDCSVNDNGNIGIYAGSGSTVTGNTAYNNGADGIYAGPGSTITGNVAYYNNYYGIYPDGNNLVDGNTAVNNNIAGGFANMSACGTCTMGLNHAP